MTRLGSCQGWSVGLCHNILLEYPFPVALEALLIDPLDASLDSALQAEQSRLVWRQEYFFFIHGWDWAPRISAKDWGFFLIRASLPLGVLGL